MGCDEERCRTWGERKRPNRKKIVGGTEMARNRKKGEAVKVKK